MLIELHKIERPSLLLHKIERPSLLLRAEAAFSSTKERPKPWSSL